MAKEEEYVCYCQECGCIMEGEERGAMCNTCLNLLDHGLI